MAYDRAGSVFRGVVMLALMLVALTWLLRRIEPEDPADLTDDPVAQIEVLARQHRSLPWRDVPVRRLGPACNDRDAESCAELAHAYADVRHLADSHFGIDLPCVDRTLLERACDGDDARGCMFLGHLARVGACGAGTERRAHGLYDRACRSGLRDACDLRDAL